MSDIKPITRALISVSDKDGIVEFASQLAAQNVELVSTGGTAKLLAEAGLAVRDVAELTGFPEMMDGRVKTLHPNVHGGLLAIRDNDAHQAAMQAHDILPIDLLVVNLYPFEATVASGGDYALCVENIDIGGPAMIRAAAKNHADVTVLVDGDDYDDVLAALAAGGTDLALRQKLAQKAYAEGAIALCLYGSQLFEDSRSLALESEKEAANELLELLIPVIKSWPSKYGPEANSLAIQVLGGSGYTREYPVEQYYRDNRLNAIHEGTEGIHGLDLLGRKILQKNGMGFGLLIKDIDNTIAQAQSLPQLVGLSVGLQQGTDTLKAVTQSLLEHLAADVELALANATLYLDLMGRVVVSWVWLRQACIAVNGLAESDVSEQDTYFYSGKIQAAQYYIEWELPQINAQAKILMDANAACYAMRDEWF